ncbi:MAG TPA: helix-turn-helix domain-containing protein [Hyphomicrobiales bacterium]|nr:helix-turn-helix domain-containing protein [Hyphomicrobiales bacterium]
MAIVKFKLDPANPPMYTKKQLARLDALTEEQIEAAALSDPDSQPMTESQMHRILLAQRIKKLRKAHNLSQEAFARRFRIPLGTLRDLEQARRQPDAITRAYIKVIEADPDFVAKALAKRKAA